MATDVSRRWAWGGVIGPATFIGAWVVLGSGRTGYSPVDDTISRLAAVGADTRPAMTLGLGAFGAGVLAFSTVLRPALGRRVGWMAGASAVATIGVAAVPLGTSVDAGHAVMAALAYGTLAATPLVAAPSFARAGRRAAMAASVTVGLASAAALLASALVSDGAGLWQRVGLTLGDGWLIATGAWLATRR